MEGSRVLDLGGTLVDELPSAVFGITTKRQIGNPVLLKSWKLPFKDSVFSFVVSYHYFDLIPFDKLGPVFSEIARVLQKDAVFSFMILLWAPQNEAQRSSLFFNELLRNTGALYSHEFEDVTRHLSNSGFSEITVETIKRDIPVPRDYIRSHLLMLSNLVKKDSKEGGSGIRMFAKQYFSQVNVHGEAMLPALHFIARKMP
ncbi:MAG: class I SAM-dependent methyltransferase [Candidatus Methanoperedens sp.]|nr:class I SAM-dependent methyltransferase [Candidatus Methanoperedens sp.]MCE8428460.1 class I SAM-dependent methyltransferase [Candidatus Methanoperedens sp.]